MRVGSRLERRRSAEPSTVGRARHRSRAFVVVSGALVVALLPASGAHASIGGLLGALFGGGNSTTTPAPASPSTRVPGTPVPQLPQVNQSKNGGSVTKVGTVPSTFPIGVPGPGTVPVIGKVSAAADDGAYVAYETRVDPRTVDLMIASPALAGNAPVRVILPVNWFAQPATTWPSLYLLHGASEKADYQSWSLYTDVEAFTANKNVMTVMPSDGSAGFGTNWWNVLGGGKGDNYDTFIATEVPQILQRGYHASTKQAVAGVSIGGYGAMALAALHPGEYGAAASYSGVPDSVLPLITTLIQGILVREGLDPLAMWGDPILNFFRWEAHNPTNLAPQLKGVNIFVSSGNGNVGPLDPPGASGDPLDAASQIDSQSFVGKLQALKIPVWTDFYGNGTHSWPYWNRELQKSWLVLAAGLGLPAN